MWRLIFGGMVRLRPVQDNDFSSLCEPHPVATFQRNACSKKRWNTLLAANQGGMREGGPVAAHNGVKAWPNQVGSRRVQIEKLTGSRLVRDLACEVCRGARPEALASPLDRLIFKIDQGDGPVWGVANGCLCKPFWSVRLAHGNVPTHTVVDPISQISCRVLCWLKRYRGQWQNRANTFS